MISMRNIIGLWMMAFSCFLLSSCGSGNNADVSSRQRELVDSLRKDSIMKAHVADSIKNVRKDSLAMIAWGDTRFGMSKQEVMKSKAFSGGRKERVNSTGYDSYSMNYETRYEFSKQNGLKELNSIVAEFSENELYKIQMKSFERAADRLDYMIEDCNKLIRQFALRYGSPWKKKDDVSILSFEDSRDEKILIAHIVVSGHVYSKSIAVELYAKDYRYHYEITIANYDFHKRNYEPTKEELEQKRREDELSKNIKEYSF